MKEKSILRLVYIKLTCLASVAIEFIVQKGSVLRALNKVQGMILGLLIEWEGS